MFEMGDRVVIYRCERGCEDRVIGRGKVSQVEDLDYSSSDNYAIKQCIHVLSDDGASYRTTKNYDSSSVSFEFIKMDNYKRNLESKIKELEQLKKELCEE